MCSFSEIEKSIGLLVIEILSYGHKNLIKLLTFKYYSMFLKFKRYIKSLKNAFLMWFYLVLKSNKVLDKMSKI